MYHQHYYKLFCIDLSREPDLNIPQQITFTGKLEEDDGAKKKKNFIAENQQKVILSFSLDSLVVTE